MARIVFEVAIDGTPSEVLRALDTEQGIAGWWSEDVEFAGGRGSIMKIGFPDRAPAPFELRVDEANEQRVRWTNIGDFPPHWADTHITWTLTPEANGGGTTVHFSHDGWTDDEGLFPMSAFTWGQLMGSLAAWVESGTGTPLYRKS